MYGIDFPRTELPIDPVETNGYFDVSISISLMQSLYEKLNSGMLKSPFVVCKLYEHKRRKFTLEITL